MDIEKIKEVFPIFIKNPDLVYLDSAATTQKPVSVIEAMTGFYSDYCANVHRGIYKISEEATEKYELAREKVRDFIGANSEREIVYTRGTTESINLVMRSYGEKFIRAGDKIVITIAEHHSNFVPWQQLAERKKAKLEIIDITDDGDLKEDDAKTKIKGAKIVAVSHVSNVLGTANPIKDICDLARDSGAVSIIDGAQSTPHMKINVKESGCDFFAFSGHKMLGPTGIGILYGKEHVLETTDPFLYGGDMISEVRPEKSEWNSLPYKFEAGTPPIAEAIGLGAALDFLNAIGMENVHKHEKELTRYAMQLLGEIKNLSFYGPKNADKKIGVMTFNLAGIHSHDVASILSEHNVAIRTGHHCAMPLHERLGLGATARASLYLYNTKDDINKLADGLKEANNVFRVG